MLFLHIFHISYKSNNSGDSLTGYHTKCYDYVKKTLYKSLYKLDERYEVWA